jgi:hypothetical protein
MENNKKELKYTIISSKKNSFEEDWKKKIICKQIQRLWFVED